MSSPYGYIKRRGIGRRQGEKNGTKPGFRLYVLRVLARFNSVRRLTGMQDYVAARRKVHERFVPAEIRRSRVLCRTVASFSQRIYSRYGIYLMDRRLFPGKPYELSLLILTRSPVDDGEKEIIVTEGIRNGCKESDMCDRVDKRVDKWMWKRIK